MSKLWVQVSPMINDREYQEVFTSMFTVKYQRRILHKEIEKYSAMCLCDIFRVNFLTLLPLDENNIFLECQDDSV